MSQNTLKENNQPRESVKGDKIINVKTERKMIINGQEFLMEERSSKPDDEGNYDDTVTIHVTTDHAGNPFPEDPRSILAFSHSGLSITSSDHFDRCTSRFHTRPSRNILLGQDGRKLPNDTAICSHCDSWSTTFYLLIGLIGFGVVLGLFSGVGFF